ncbi:tyrosine-type recombinase/integrase [Neobacillus sp. D3-1R]|uniref:tyrosine-type recombinase/integrase n=1 Tax=Neobacillus sp. D3-1R TaxID=3445778 RepID=UPI003FA090CE
MEFVDPIYDKSDIPRLRKSLKQQVNGDIKILAFELGLQTALRPSDLLNLTVKDVKNGIVKTRASKTHKPIEIRLNDKVYDLVKAHILMRDLQDEDKLFNMNRTTLYRALNKAGKDIGLEETLGAHSIRKTKAFHTYIDSKFDISLVMELLQHDEAGSTLHYIGWKKERLQEKLAEFNEL